MGAKRLALPVIAAALLLFSVAVLFMPKAVYGATSNATSFEKTYVGTWEGVYCNIGPVDKSTGELLLGQSYSASEVNLTFTMEIKRDRSATLVGKSKGQSFTSSGKINSTKDLTNNGLTMIDSSGAVIGIVSYEGMSQGNEWLTILQYQSDGTYLLFHCKRSSSNNLGDGAGLKGQNKSKVQSEYQWARSLGKNAYAISPLLNQQIGVEGWFYGYVINVHYASGSKGQPTFIDFGSFDSKNGSISYNFTGIIWGDDRSSFPSNLNQLEGQMVAIYGQTYQYRSKTRAPERQIRLTSPSQIRVYPN